MSTALLWLVGLLNSIITVAGLAWAAKRLLGLRVGTGRALAGGLVGFLVSWTTTLTLPQDNPLAVMAMGLGIAVTTAMTFIVVSEALVPTGTWPRPFEAVIALRRRLARTRRYSQIMKIAVRHDLVPYLRGRRRAADAELARSLRQALDEGGVTFVKLGQALSTRGDVLPQGFLDELSLLQDRVTPVPLAEIEPVLAEEFGASPESIFAKFDPEPLAAASIAQVHRAQLRSGEEVVVKVQRPGIRQLVERDLDIARRIAATLERRTSWARGLGVSELARGFADALREELDFRTEARNLAAMSAATGQADVHLPRLYKNLSTERVLVLEWVDGIALNSANAEIEERGLDKAALARTLLHSLLAQLMLDGVFHADPHPGNIMLRPDGTLALVDFGSVGRLDAQLRAALQNLLIALARNDPASMCDALLEIVNHPEDIDERQLERALGRFMARHMGPGMTPDMEMSADLFRLVADFGLAVPPAIALAFGTAGTLEGTLRRLDPGFDVVTEAREYAKSQMNEQLRPEALRKTATDELLGLLPVLRRIPRRFDRITHSLEQGRLSVNIRLFADERDRRIVTELLHQVLLAVFGATSGLVAVMLLGTEGGPEITENVSLFQVFGYNLLAISSILVLRVLFIIFRSDNR